METIGGITDSWAYAYDARGQLVEVQRNSVVVEVYGYDDNGNRTSAIVDAVAVTGSYDVQASLPGFRTELQRGVQVGLGTQVRLDFVFNPSAVQDEIVERLRRGGGAGA